MQQATASLIALLEHQRRDYPRDLLRVRSRSPVPDARTAATDAHLTRLGFLVEQYREAIDVLRGERAAQ